MRYRIRHALAYAFLAVNLLGHSTIETPKPSDKINLLQSTADRLPSKEKIAIAGLWLLSLYSHSQYSNISQKLDEQKKKLDGFINQFPAAQSPDLETKILGEKSPNPDNESPIIPQEAVSKIQVSASPSSYNLEQITASYEEREKQQNNDFQAMQKEASQEIQEIKNKANQKIQTQLNSANGHITTLLEEMKSDKQKTREDIETIKNELNAHFNKIKKGLQEEIQSLIQVNKQLTAFLEEHQTKLKELRNDHGMKILEARKAQKDAERQLIELKQKIQMNSLTSKFQNLFKI